MLKNISYYSELILPCNCNDLYGTCIIKKNYVNFQKNYLVETELEVYGYYLCNVLIIYTFNVMQINTVLVYLFCIGVVNM